MKNFLLATTLVLAGAFAGAQVHQAAADPQSPPPPPAHGGWGMDAHGGFPPGPMGWWHHDDAFGLFAHVANKNLSTADVRVIAQAKLLEHGNHDWTVTDIVPAGQEIDFSYASPHGDVIATFAIDPATGHMRRVS